MPAPDATTTSQDGQQTQQTSTQQPTTTQTQQAQTTTQQQNPDSQSQQSQNTTGGDNNRGGDQATRGLIADLQKERTARQTLERQIAQLQGNQTLSEKRIRALVGVDTPSEDEAAVEQIRSQFAKVFPGLAKLTDEQIARVLQVAETGDSLQQATQHHWEQHATTVLGSLVDEVSEMIGNDLTDRQQKALKRAFIAEAESNPEFLARFQRNDAKLVAEFAKEFVDDWFESARRRVTTDVVQRQRPVPGGRDRTVQTTAPVKVDFKNPKAVEDAMVASFKSHGGRFDTN